MFRRAFLICVALVATAAPMVGQNWIRTYGTDADEYGSTYQISDGGLLIVGSTDSAGAGDRDLWLARLDPAGNVLWQKTYGGPAREVGGRALELPGGGFLVLAGTDSWGAGERDAWLLEIDEDGDLLWQQAYGTEDSELPNAIIPAQDGGYFIVGNTTAKRIIDIWVLKLDAARDVEWSRTYGTLYIEIPYEARLTSDGGLVMGGSTFFLNEHDEEEWDMIVLLIDSEGRCDWLKRLGGRGEDLGFDVVFTLEGFVAAGSTTSVGDGTQAAWLVKISRSGTLDWQRAFGSGTSAFSLDQASSGGYLMAGQAVRPGRADMDAFILGLDSDGHLDWQRRYGGDFDENLWRVQETPDGRIAASGTTSSYGAGRTDLWVFRLPPDGVIGPCCLLLDGQMEEKQPQGLIHDITESPQSVTVTATSTSAAVANFYGRVSELCTGDGWEAPPELVSDQPSGEPPLLVLPNRQGLRLEVDPDSLAYNVYADALGSWYAPRDRKGSVCAVEDWTDNGDGTLDLDYEIPPNSWILVTGSNGCGEGPAGPDSAGTERTQMGTWIRCGPGP